MTKSEFTEKIKAEGLNVGRMYQSARHTQIEGFAISNAETIEIHPDSERLSPGIRFSYTPVKVPSLTTSPYTKANANFIGDKLKPYRKFWKKEFTAWKRALPAAKKHEIKFAEICRELGFTLEDSRYYRIFDLVWKKQDLKKYNATGKYLGVVEMTTVTTYAKSCQWGPSSREDTFLVGQNENGNPFAHQVSNNCFKIAGAVDWIWHGANVETRHGDIGIASCNLKHVEGEEKELTIPGASSHKIKGEIRQNGSLYARNAFLFHEKEQHPFAYIGSDWKRIVVGRHSEKMMSSAD